MNKKNIIAKKMFFQAHREVEFSLLRRNYFESFFADWIKFYTSASLRNW